MFIRDSGSIQLMNKYMNLQIWILNKSSTLGIFNFVYKTVVWALYSTLLIFLITLFCILVTFLRLYSKADPHSKRPSHGDCESHPFGYKYKYRDSWLAYHNLIVWQVKMALIPPQHLLPQVAPTWFPHSSRMTHQLTVGSPHDCRPATGHRSYGRLAIKLFQILKGTARTS